MLIISNNLILLLCRRLDKKTCRIILAKRNNLKEINIKNCNCYYFGDIIRIEDFDIDIFY